MTCTKPEDFKKFLKQIPSDNLKSTSFIPIRQDHKFPDVPHGTKIQLENGLINRSVKIDVRTCIQRLKGGKNVAIYAFRNGLMFLDLDVENGKIKASDEFIKHIPPTFTVRTRNGGLQFYYLNNNEANNHDIYENDVNIGELRVNWQYVVGVGSYVTPDVNNNNGDGTYRIINDVPIVPMPTEFLNKLKTMVETKKQIEPTAKCERPPKETMTKEEFDKMLKEKGKVRRLMK